MRGEQRLAPEGLARSPVSLPDDSASEAWPSRWAGKAFSPTPVTGCPLHMSPAAAHMV